MCRKIIPSPFFLVQVRSILLRGFDQQMADKIGVFMEKNGVKFIRGAVPKSVEQVRNMLFPHMEYIAISVFMIIWYTCLYASIYGVYVGVQMYRSKVIHI